MSNKKGNTQYDILDKILADSQTGRDELVWISDPRHKDGGYYVPASSAPAAANQFKSVDDLERYLRS